MYIYIYICMNMYVYTILATVMLECLKMGMLKIYLWD